jgi:hypothetical protein
MKYEPHHDKTNIVRLRQAWIQTCLRICPCSLIRINAVCLPTLLQVEKLIVNSMDPDQTARLRRLVWIHAGRKCTMLVLSWRGSNFLLDVFSLHRRQLLQTPAWQFLTNAFWYLLMLFLNDKIIRIYISQRTMEIKGSVFNFK